MDNIENNQQGQKRVKGKINYVTSLWVWQKKEEDALMVAMMDLISDKWYNENGQFKTRLFAKLEHKLNVVFPKTDLSTSPHIESKVKLWKKYYYALVGMLNTSGFGWDDIEKTLNIDRDQVWENYLKKDPNAKGLRYVSFPYYDKWCILFGKYREIGDLAAGPAEVVATMNEEEVQTNYNTINTHLPIEMDFSTCKTKSMGCSQERKKSRNESTSIDLASMAEQFGNFCATSNEKMIKIVQRIGYDHVLSKTRKMVYAELKKILLDSCNRLKAASMIFQNADKVDLFFSLPKEDRVEWVYMLLGGNI